MSCYSLSHLSDPALLHGLASIVSQDRATTATLLAHVAEVDERKLYIPAAQDSMFSYCVHELHMSEDVAYKRICAARAARRFPAIFTALAEGRLHVSAVVMLAPHLAPDTAGDLLAAAAHKSKAAIERLLAERFPKPDLPTVVRPLAPVVAAHEPALERVDVTALQLAPGRVALPGCPNSSEPAVPLPESLPPRARIAPLAPERFALQVTITGSAHDLLRQAQALLGHAVPTGDVAQVIERALEVLVEKLEKQKFATCARSGPRRGSTNARLIPAAVKRAVFERDGGQCSFVSERGQRCESRTRLEFDHVEAVARGGQATVAGIRLLCRAHNQHAAAATFGTAFMRGKREQARDRAANRKPSARAGAPRACGDANVARLVTSPSPPHPAAAPPPGAPPRT
jgi:5-methylcytosine-specific restriction endonuclease McrA